MLNIKDVSVNFGGIKAVDKASMQIETGKITGLIGPNGAGKTTLFNIIAGNIKPTMGKVMLGEQDITSLPSHELFEKGVLRTFQLAHEFSNMTVLENLMVVPGMQTGEKILNTWFQRKRIENEEKAIKEKALEVVNFLKLDHLTYELAGNLSGGQKKLLELGRTMMVEAKIVLLDEVGAGVNRTLLNDITDIIKKLNYEKNYTFFMIEHDMNFLSKLCDKVIVMTEGSVLVEGGIDEIKKNEKVIEAYLGRGQIE
jgi:branched-chain amino acid transport system ATP-binding protein